MGAKWIRKWDGGRVRSVRGAEVFVIERRGRVITLTVTSERDAKAELALFERDPGGYRPRRGDLPERVQIDEDTLAAFMRSLVKRGTTPEYRTYVLGYLRQWDRALSGAFGVAYDLRALRLRDLRRLLDRWKTAEHHRIVALKSFTAWLRAEDRLALAEDPTVSLAVPQATPEKSIRPKGYPLQDVREVYRRIESQVIRDVIRMRAATGMHESEIRRVAAGDATLREVRDASGIWGTVTFLHKRGKMHIVSVDRATYEAAQRLQAAGGIPCRVLVHRALQRAAQKAGKRDLHPGELRHSFATWASELGREVRPTGAGVSLAAVAAVMGHTNTKTTSRFYVGVEVPPMIALPLQLEHDEDPRDPPPVAQAARAAEAVPLPTRYEAPVTCALPLRTATLSSR